MLFIAILDSLYWTCRCSFLHVIAVVFLPSSGLIRMNLAAFQVFVFIYYKYVQQKNRELFFLEIVGSRPFRKRPTCRFIQHPEHSFCPQQHIQRMPLDLNGNTMGLGQRAVNTAQAINNNVEYTLIDWHRYGHGHSLHTTLQVKMIQTHAQYATQF